MTTAAETRRGRTKSPARVVRVATSAARDTRTAMGAVLDELGADDAVLTLLFHSPSHDAKVVAEILAARTGERSVAGTTAGEISSLGFAHDTITGIAFHGSHVRAAVGVIPRLSHLSLVPVRHLAVDLAERLGLDPAELDPASHAWLLLVDGLSGQEDLVTPFFARFAQHLPLVGGSLADEDQFDTVILSHDGQTYSDAAAVILLEYTRPFELIHHTHMEMTEHFFEVTRVSQGGRVIEELDGRTAVEAYAAALGIEPEDVTIEVTGFHPLGRRFRGRAFPCSIMQPLPDGSFHMAYSVQHGERLHLLEPVDMVEKSAAVMSEALDRLHARGATPQAALLFNCMGRYIEMQTCDLVDPVFEALHQAPLCGLNTYGEQFATMHMNHSLTGIVFG